MIVCSNPQCQTTAGCKCGQTLGAYIPIETTAAAWKQIAEDRMAAVEMWKAKAAQHEAEIERLREWLRCVHDLLDKEIGVRFRTSSHRTEEEVGKNSRVYALLAPFRNMARSALNGEPYLKPGP